MGLGKSKAILICSIIFYILCYTLDIVSTVWSLNLGAREVNPLGWPLGAIVGSIVLCVFVSFTLYILFYNWKVKLAIAILVASMCFVGFLHLLAALHNLIAPKII